jgi:AcrR family transcriptional regulator
LSVKESQPRKTKAKSGRRAAGESRRAILAVATKRLAEGGPEAIRLQDIARDVGLSHPTILHHFGSRDGLMQALAQDAEDRLSADVLRVFSVPAEQATVASLVTRVFETLGDSGHARLLAWRGLIQGEPLPEDSEQAMLQRITDVIHLRRVEYALAHAVEVPTREDSAFLVRLLGAALLGDAVAGPVYNLRAELDGQRDPEKRFRAWLAELVTRHVTGEAARSEDS